MSEDDKQQASGLHSASEPTCTTHAIMGEEEEGREQGENEATGGYLRKEWERIWENIFQPPRVLHSWDLDSEETELRANWTELFYDLVYFAAIINLGFVFKLDITVSGLFEFLLYFASLWWTWQRATHYLSTIVIDDYLHQYLIFSHTLGVLGMALSLQNGFGNYKGFLISYAISHFFMAILYALVYCYIPQVRSYSKVILGANVMSVVAMLVASFLPVGPAVVVWTATLVVEIFLCLIPARQKNRMKIDFGYAMERCGLFVMIALDEILVTLVLPPHDYNPDYFIVAIFSFWMIFNQELNFFDTQPSAECDLLTRSHIRSRALTLLHLFVSACLVCTAVGVQACVYSPLSPMDPPALYLLSGSVAVSLWLMQAAKMVNQEPWGSGGKLFRRKFRSKAWIVCFTLWNVLPVGCLLISLIPDLLPRDALLILWAITLLYSFVGVFARHRWPPEESKSEDGLDVESLVQHIPEPTTDMQTFLFWDTDDVIVWLANELKTSERTQQIALRVGLTGRHLVDIPAADLLTMFGERDGVAVILGLAAVVRAGGRKLKRGRSLRNTRNLLRQRTTVLSHNGGLPTPSTVFE